MQPRRLKKTLISAAVGVAAIAGTAGFAAGSQTAMTGPPPGAAAFAADTGLDPATSTPAQVARYFDSLSPAEQRKLAAEHPATVGNLDGAPVKLRLAANHQSLFDSRDGQLERLEERKVLAMDPRGRGQIAEVFGDLDKAEHIAVLVPGSDTDLRGYNNAHKQGAALQKSMAKQDPDSAVVVWAGYTTPEGVGVDAATGRLADAGAPRLVSFMKGLSATTDPADPPALLCHSYGSVVCGKAAADLGPKDADDIVAFASPGMRAHTAADLHANAQVWAARNDSDWIGNVPNVSLAGLGHGADPVSAGFGAKDFSAKGAEGHDGYFAKGTDSLANFTSIALNDYEEVTPR
ncbi:hypothetical protein G5C51_26490 [Streptomyces sp. A7024]|uniref:DUF1023 domain-containing protein n=1 Tax=Streptomyces coryli TaxID=1128680 RepID=A0A6G4U8D5_9ACTN|nr:alpha/beta hydrolase [Streptomyces coryli]NGN67441.1 hypothetical protein [Streptomyces coryli]